MNQKALDLLEFPKIRERIASLTSFSGGKELALSLAPSSDRNWIEARQREVAEARELLVLRPNFALGGVHDVRPIVEQAALGALLLATQLQDVQNTLQGARTAQQTLERVREQVPSLFRRAQTMPNCETVEQEIGRCIGPRGEVLDRATPVLARLRVEARQAHDRLYERLQDLANSPRGHTMLQEPVITLRGGRYVVPVKADFRGEFHGIVHDMSASGATVFMEPLESVELGNVWRQTQIEEEREVERVLRTLSELVGDYRDDIVTAVEVLATLDLALAKARYADRLHCVRPRLGESLLRLTEARHPLLSGHVVPISLELGQEYFILLITGPNTGGKTVSLKTAGLLVLMALAGIPVPAGEAEVPLYREVFADIGDEQSIEQSLSTFSSHMTNIIDILGKATPSSLVLLDELGAGTDPTEGSALGRAIVGHLLRNQVPAIATTHHSDLKAYAHSTEGVRNASVEFDPVSLSPTYRLRVGLPGWSNAIAIASRLGLPEPLVEEARALLHPHDLQVEQMLHDIQRERDQAEAAGREIDEARRSADDARQRVAARLEELEANRDVRLEEARQEVTRELERLRGELREAERKIERALREQRREDLVAAAASMQRTEERLTTRRWRPRRPRRVEHLAAPDLSPGSRVRLATLDQMVEVVTGPSPDGEVEIQMGSFRAKVRADQLEAAPSGLRRSEGFSGVTILRAPGSDGDVSQEIHLRGLRVEEALNRLDGYLDEAFRAGYPSVRVVHGKGTGAMRHAVREVLQAHPLVRSFETAALEAGGDGVTVAHLAQ